MMGGYGGGMGPVGWVFMHSLAPMMTELVRQIPTEYQTALDETRRLLRKRLEA